MPKSASKEIRFGFGENWKRFATLLSPERIRSAEVSLASLLGVSILTGTRFLDVGSGSGLFSLAARRMGAIVHSFDYDPVSVETSQAVRARYATGDTAWTIERGSALDDAYLTSLGQYDTVYSWGVLHHTGSMWPAIEKVAHTVKPGGMLCIALYNDQGWISRYWTIVKRLYNRGPVARTAMIGLHAPYLVGARWLARLVRGNRQLDRGMSLWYDMHDWLGGYPFEVASPAAVRSFLEPRGFRQINQRLIGTRLGCNEFVFRRAPLSGPV